VTELSGQTVVAIGGSAGIGLETARRARSEGAEVHVMTNTALTPNVFGKARHLNR
jgi:NAD(P)-dependent dehydrogenase (short-subunit alcohol dehydrogenase family)